MNKFIDFLRLDGYTKQGIWHDSNILKNLFFWIRYILSDKIPDHETMYIEPDLKIVLRNNCLILFWGLYKREFSRNHK